MAYLLTWPKRRDLRASDGVTVVAVVSPGRLRLERPDGTVVEVADPAQLRDLALTLTLASTEYAQDLQHTAAQESSARRQRRKLAGEPTGVRHRPFVDPPDPPLHALDQEPA